MVRGVLAAARQLIVFPSITVQDHPNARIGSWQLGDTILVQLHVPHLGDVSRWHRIVAWELTTEDTATLTLERAE